MNSTATTPHDAPIGTAELITALNELLEAERAGARVTRETAQQIPTNQDLHGLVVDIQHDEVKWCGMLMNVIRSLQATPTDVTGAFHGKAMAIADLTERLETRKAVDRAKGILQEQLSLTEPEASTSQPTACSARTGLPDSSRPSTAKIIIDFFMILPRFVPRRRSAMLNERAARAPGKVGALMPAPEAKAAQATVTSCDRLCDKGCDAWGNG